MKKIILSGALLAMSGLAHADLIKVAVNGGYSTVTMKEVNDSLDLAKATAGTTVTGLNSGWFVGAEAGLGLMPFLELGPRVEYLKTNTGSISSSTSKTSIDGDLISGMLGVNVGMDLPLTGLGFNAGLYGGYGMATIKSASPGGGRTFQGGAFVSEIQAKLKYSVLPLLSLDLLAGIRFANMGKLKDGIVETVPVDFSGFNAGGGLTLGF